MSHRTPIRLAVDPAVSDPARFREAADILEAGGLVAYPTDTFYGLAIDPRNPAAIERLFETKGRGRNVAIPLIAADVAQAATVGVFTALGRRLANDFWPGPLTLVVAAGPGVDRALLGGRDTLAVRVPNHPVARGLARALGCPVTATSANRSGQPPSSNAADVVATLGEDLTMVIDGGAVAGGAPSTIVDTRGDDPILVREGKVPWDRVLQSSP